MGDFNHSDIKWSDIGGSCIGNGRPASLEFLDTLSENFLSQFVIDPTFGNNTLDLVISDNQVSIFNVNVYPPLGSSAKIKLHSTLFFKFILKDAHLKTTNPNKIYLFKKGNYKEINRESKQTNWHKLFDGKGVEECFELLNIKYISLFEKYIPLRSNLNFVVFDESR